MPVNHSSFLPPFIAASCPKVTPVFVSALEEDFSTIVLNVWKYYQLTRCNIAEDLKLQQHQSENPKSWKQGNA
jgi:hypothetical protein